MTSSPIPKDEFEKIKADYTGFVAKAQHPRRSVSSPCQALKGDNVVDKSAAMPWYQGAPLLNHLETVHIDSDRNLTEMRFPVQCVLSPQSTISRFQRHHRLGILTKGEEVMHCHRARSRVNRSSLRR